MNKTPDGQQPDEGQKKTSAQESHQQLRERVSFFEKVWTGECEDQTGDNHHHGRDVVDVEKLEQRLAEEKLKNQQDRGIFKSIDLTNRIPSSISSPQTFQA